MDLPAQTCTTQAKRKIASFPDYPTQPGDEARSLYSLNCFLTLVNTHTVVTVVLGPEDKFCRFVSHSSSEIAQIVLKIANSAFWASSMLLRLTAGYYSS